MLKASKLWITYSVFQISAAAAAGIPQEIFEDDYFRQNLPATYGSVSLPPTTNTTTDYREEDSKDSLFGKEVENCSQGFHELSAHLRTAAYNSSKYYNLMDR